MIYLGLIFLIRQGEISKKYLGGIMLVFSFLLADIFTGYTRLILNFKIYVRLGLNYM